MKENGFVFSPFVERYGIELDTPAGQGNGMILKRRYFTCAKNNTALFVKPNTLRPLLTLTLNKGGAGPEAAAGDGGSGGAGGSNSSPTAASTTSGGSNSPGAERSSPGAGAGSGAESKDDGALVAKDGSTEAAATLIQRVWKEKSARDKERDIKLLHIYNALDNTDEAKGKESQKIVQDLKGARIAAAGLALRFPLVWSCESFLSLFLCISPRILLRLLRFVSRALPCWRGGAALRCAALCCVLALHLQCALWRSARARRGSTSPRGCSTPTPSTTPTRTRTRTSPRPAPLRLHLGLGPGPLPAPGPRKRRPRRLPLPLPLQPK